MNHWIQGNLTLEHMKYLSYALDVEQLSFAVCPAMNHVRAHALLQALVVEQRLHLLM